MESAFLHEHCFVPRSWLCRGVACVVDPSVRNSPDGALIAVEGLWESFTLVADDSSAAPVALVTWAEGSPPPDREADWKMADFSLEFLGERCGVFDATAFWRGEVQKACEMSPAGKDTSAAVVGVGVGVACCPRINTGYYGILYRESSPGVADAIWVQFVDDSDSDDAPDTDADKETLLEDDDKLYDAYSDVTEGAHLCEILREALAVVRDFFEEKFAALEPEEADPYREEFAAIIGSWDEALVALGEGPDLERIVAMREAVYYVQEWCSETILMGHEAFDPDVCENLNDTGTDTSTGTDTGTDENVGMANSDPSPKSP